MYIIACTNQAPWTDVQFLFNFCSNFVLFLFNFHSISVQFPFKFCSIELKLNGNQTKRRWVDPLMIVQRLTCPISDELTSDVRKLVRTNSQYFILNYSIIPCPPIINEKVYILLRIHMIQNGLIMVSKLLTLNKSSFRNLYILGCPKNQKLTLYIDF